MMRLAPHPYLVSFHGGAIQVHERFIITKGLPNLLEIDSSTVQYSTIPLENTPRQPRLLVEFQVHSFLA